MRVRVAAEKCDGRQHSFRGHVKPQGGLIMAKVRFLEPTKWKHGRMTT